MPPKLIDSFYKRSHDVAKAHITCSSWGGSTSSTYDYAAAEADEFSHNTRDHLLVFACGNEESDFSVTTPAVAKNVLAVGASANAAESAQTVALEVLTPVL